MQWLTNEQWLTAKQWLTDNAVWLGSAASLATIATFVWLLWKPLRSKALFCWSRIIPAHKPGPTLPVTDLRFVAILEQCDCTVGKVAHEVGHDEFTEIHACWYVTNASEAKIPLLLLRARILEPPIGGVFCPVTIERRVRGGAYSPEREPIQPGETCKVFIHFVHDMAFVEVHPRLPLNPLRVIFAVTDQFAREHRVPPLRFCLWPEKDKDVATAHTAE